MSESNTDLVDHSNDTQTELTRDLVPSGSPETVKIPSSIEIPAVPLSEVVILVPDDNAILNGILRIYDTGQNFQSITNPVQQAPLERDHFFEIQHIVTIILAYPTVWRELKAGLLLDVSSMINDPRNLFQIAKTLNQAKKTILWASYPIDGTITRYRGFSVPPQGWNTVDGSLRNLVTAMINRQSAYNTLTRHVGGRIQVNMRW